MNAYRSVVALILIGVFGAPTLADPPPFEEVLLKAEAKFEPATAKPGQTVTLKVSLSLLQGWHTYPIFQPDKGAKSYTNKFTFPTGGAVVFVGETVDPTNPKEKAEGDIERMLYYPGGGTWEMKAVVLPNTTPGSASSKVMFRIQLCDKDNCIPTKTIEIEAKLKIDGDPVPVDPKYKSEVEKAMKK